MSELNIIRKLEDILYIELRERKSIGWQTRGYVKNDDGNIIWIGLYDVMLDNLDKIAPLLEAFPKLSFLSLPFNQISELTPLEKLTNLKYLDLRENKINDLQSLRKLQNLSYLFLRNNQITDISPLASLKNLKVLYLSSNKINDPSPLQHLTKLTTLYLADNQLNLIEALTNLTNIIKLDISSNKIKDIASLARLNKLTELYCTNNLVSDLQPLSALSNLTVLHLFDNKIKDVKPLESLPKLITLGLLSNQISDIQPLSKLFQLKTLDLSSNQIRNIAPLAELTKLKTLYLSNNQINDLSPLQKLSNITTLHLVNNLVHSLLPLRQLSKITQLDIRQNQLKELPPWIVNFDEAIYWNQSYVSTGINVYENPLRTPPPEIVKQGKKIIAYYFAQLKIQKEDRIFEAKMLIVGEPGAGKTSLARKIVDANAKLPQEGDTTRGIHVQQYQFPIFKSNITQPLTSASAYNKNFSINLWDFGGQEIYKATHRFFLSKRSLYALVADSRNEDTDFNYWLHIIEMFGGNSPLLIILNEKYQRKKTLDIPTMKARFKNIVDIISVDLAEEDKTRLNQLTYAIRYHASRLPHIGSLVPSRWTIVRDALENNPKNTISLQEYLQICAKNNITKTEDALVLSQYFHDLGVFLHFQDDPLLKNTIFLNYTWATSAVYQILDNALLNQQEGRFDKTDAVKIWSAEEYSLLHDELLQLMKKFFLTYEIDHSGKYILPERLPASTPDYTWEKTTNLTLQYKYDFFMPKGILSQFIVQMNRYISDHRLVWKRGVILEREGEKAEILESYDTRTIKIRVTGVNRRDFMTIISEKIDELNSQYEKMEVEKLIPCNCAECKANKTPYFYKHADLKRRIKKGRQEVECGRSYEMVNVRALIDDVINDKKKEESWDERNKIFISYSHKDGQWLERVKTHLKSLKHLGVSAKAWEDTKLKAGTRWKDEIEKAMGNAEVAILLISADFFASDFITEKELPSLLEAAKDKGTVILPVIVKPSLFAKTELSDFQVAGGTIKSLIEMSEAEQEIALTKLAERVAELVN